MARTKLAKSNSSKDKGHTTPARTGYRALTYRPGSTPDKKEPRKTVSVLLEAAAEVFAEKGYAGATTNKIAHRAGVSIGSLYQYFPSKDAILAGLREQHLSDVQIVVDRSMRELADVNVPIGQALGSLLRGLINLHEEKPKLTRALSEEVLPPHSVEDIHRNKEEEHYARATEQILRRRSDVRPGDYAVMAHILVQTIQALTRWYVHEAPTDLEKEPFIDEALRLLGRLCSTQVVIRKPKTAN